MSLANTGVCKSQLIKKTEPISHAPWLEEVAVAFRDDVIALAGCLENSQLW
jgi:hypothetical protein